MTQFRGPSGQLMTIGQPHTDLIKFTKTYKLLTATQ